MLSDQRENGFSGQDRALQARIAVLTSWARTVDRSARTAPARQASEERFERLVDPDGTMSPQARALSAEAARRAHFLRMAHKSAEVRRRKSAQRADADRASDIDS